jgi:CheY-like chemotaxis protein
LHEKHYRWRAAHIGAHKHVGVKSETDVMAETSFNNASQAAVPCSARARWSAPRVEVLAITPFLADQVLLRKLLADTGWDLGIIPEFETATAHLLAHPITVVLCDRDLPGFDWHDTLEILTSIAQASAVILLSSVVDEYLWAEVIQNGGFDVIAKPFRQQELVETIKFALFYHRWSWLERIERVRR